MATDPSAVERAYALIKGRILDGKLPVRTRIEVDSMAKALGSSSMPVRQALTLLTAERLIRPSSRAGYEVSLWTAAELAALYQWRGALVSMALPAAGGSELARIARTQPYAEAVFNVMRAIEASANRELQRAALSADERLFIARRAEEEVLGDVAGELETLVSALGARSKRAPALVRSYHRRRVQHAATLRERVILRATPANGTPD